jgi:hypothetical protein
MAQPETVWSKEVRTQLPWAGALVCPDPRLYEQTEQTLTLYPSTTYGSDTSQLGTAQLGTVALGAPAAVPSSGNLVNKGNIPAPLEVTITLAYPGSSRFIVVGSGVGFVLDLSTCTAGDVIAVVMETCGPHGRGRRITKNGSEAFHLKVSGVDSWIDAPAGTTSFAIINDTNVTSCVLAWYHTRS